MINIGLVGTGFVAQRRADAIQADGRGRLVAVSGHLWADTQAFAQAHHAVPVADWQTLVTLAGVDLVMVCSINSEHGPVALAALAAGKHVVVEYPLSLDLAEAEAIVALAQTQQRLLHIEHIELLGGSHQAFKQHLPTLGPPIYARYCTLAPRRPAPQTWAYCPRQFGFPLVGALSRLHRLIDGFGPVVQVYSQVRYGENGVHPTADLSFSEVASGYYTSCLCTAQLTFQSGLVADVIYGKGEALWPAEKRLEVWGQTGGLVLEGGRGTVTTAHRVQSLDLGTRRGLFAADTRQVFDHLLNHQPLYVSPADSLYSLRVATAAATSACSGQVVSVA